MTVPTRQRTHLLAGPSLSGGSCGSISGNRGRVGRAGHRRGDRAVARRPAGRPGQGVSSAPRIGGEAPYPFQRTSGPAADPVAPSARLHEHVVGSGSPRCARPQSASTKREAGRGGRVTSQTARLRRADLREQFRKTRSCSGLDSPFALVGILDRFALCRQVLAAWRCLPTSSRSGGRAEQGGLRHVPDRQDDRLEAGPGPGVGSLSSHLLQALQGVAILDVHLQISRSIRARESSSGNTKHRAIGSANFFSVPYNPQTSVIRRLT
jgi:hypothetical protein